MPEPTEFEKFAYQVYRELLVINRSQQAVWSHLLALRKVLSQTAPGFEEAYERELTLSNSDQLIRSFRDVSVRIEEHLAELQRRTGVRPEELEIDPLSKQDAP